ncbi:MAG: hypothetical protein IH606_18205 [Burkholderiales bacterium]|nr:hypothetical protein [Burkholderiales bacterium]
MRKTLTALVAVCIGLAGPATQANAGLFSATREVIAMLAGELFVGEAEGHLDGSGTLAIHSQVNPGLSCRGKFSSSAELGGLGTFLCSDGATATFHFQRLGLFRGFGAGSFSRGGLSFAYGFTADEAAAYLKLPEGKKLSRNGIELTLVDL